MKHGFYRVQTLQSFNEKELINVSVLQLVYIMILLAIYAMLGIDTLHVIMQYGYMMLIIFLSYLLGITSAVIFIKRNS